MKGELLIVLLVIAFAGLSPQGCAYGKKLPVNASLIQPR